MSLNTSDNVIYLLFHMLLLCRFQTSPSDHPQITHSVNFIHTKKSLEEANGTEFLVPDNQKKQGSHLQTNSQGHKLRPGLQIYSKCYTHLTQSSAFLKTSFLWLFSEEDVLVFHTDLSSHVQGLWLPLHVLLQIPDPPVTEVGNSSISVTKPKAVDSDMRVYISASLYEKRRN